MVLLAYVTSEIFGDGDTYWHLAAGQWILEHHEVPTVDPFSYTRLGKPWVDHEWLSQCLMALFYDWGGWTGLVLLTSGSYSLTLAYVMRFLLSRVQPLHALLFMTLAASVMLGHLLARPHVLAWPLLAVWVGTLINASEKNLSPPWWLVALMALWANLHLSHILGLVLVVPLALDAALRVTGKLHVPVIRKWTLFLLVSAAAALLTPAGWKNILPFLEIFTLKHLHRVGEWQSANFGAITLLEIWLMLLLILAMTGYLRLRMLTLILLIGLLHQALAHARFIAVFGLITPMLIAESFGQQYRMLSGDRPQAQGIDKAFESLTAPAKPVAVVVAILAVFATTIASGYAGRHVPREFITPAAAVDAAIKAGAKGNLFNQYDFGGYLIFRKIPPFIDGRAEVYGNQLMDAYIDATDTNKVEKIRKTLDDYKISWTLLSPNSMLILYLDTQSDWQKVYEDKTAVVHLRKVAP